MRCCQCGYVFQKEWIKPSNEVNFILKYIMKPLKHQEFGTPLPKWPKAAFCAFFLFPKSSQNSYRGANKWSTPQFHVMGQSRRELIRWYWKSRQGGSGGGKWKSAARMGSIDSWQAGPAVPGLFYLMEMKHSCSISAVSSSLRPRYQQG